MARILDFADSFESSVEPTASPIAASAISNTPSGNLAATNVQAALNELQSDVDTRATSTSLSDHISDSSAAHSASAIASTPSGNLAATDVQAALNELQSDIDSRATSSSLSDHISDSTSAHAASAISNTPSGNLAATDVQGALNELQSSIDTALTNPMTTGGDIIYGGASGVATRLANGSSGAALVSTGGTSAPTWGSILASGTYTPTLTAITNVASLTASNATRYLRVGSVVMVSGQCDMDPTADSGLFVFDISLPIASNFSSQAQLTGTCGTDGAGSDIGAGVNYIRAEITNDRARVTGILTTALHGSNQTYFTFSYQII